MSLFDRYLSLRVALCIVVGVTLGSLFPGLFQTIAAWEHASVNLVVAVLIWSQLTRGDANYTLVQVSLNDVIMIFAFAPIVALLLGVTDIEVPWETLLLLAFLYSGDSPRGRRHNPDGAGSPGR